MTGRNVSSGPPWGCIGTVAAAIVAGVFSVIVALINDVSILDIIRMLQGDGGLRLTPVAPAVQSTPFPTPFPTSFPALGQSPASDTPAPFATQSVRMPWEVSPAEVATPNLDEIMSGMFMPAASSCPPDARAVNMSIPMQWYGPFGFNLNQFIMYDAWRFYLWDAAQYNVFTGSYGVSSQVNRVPNEPINQWLQLPNSFFWVCIDSSGYLYTVYTGS